MVSRSFFICKSKLSASPAFRIFPFLVLFSSPNLALVHHSASQRAAILEAILEEALDDSVFGNHPFRACLNLCGKASHLTIVVGLEIQSNPAFQQDPGLLGLMNASEQGMGTHLPCNTITDWKTSLDHSIFLRGLNLLRNLRFAVLGN